MYVDYFYTAEALGAVLVKAQSVRGAYKNAIEMYGGTIEEVVNTASELLNNGLPEELKLFHDNMDYGGVEFFDDGETITYNQIDGIPFGKIVSDNTTVVSPIGNNWPEPSKYLSETYVNSHLHLFAEGCSYIVLESSIYTSGQIGSNDGLFVLSKSAMDQLLNYCEGSVSRIELLLGITPGHFANKLNNVNSQDKLLRIDIPTSSLHNLRMANGNELDAPLNWVPGGISWNYGHSFGGAHKHAVIDPIPIGNINEYSISTIIE